MDNQDRSDIKKASRVLIAANDPRFNYQFIKNDNEIDNFNEIPTIITMNQYDWCVKIDEGDINNLPKLCPLSLASSHKNLDDMEAFYAAKFPRLPSEYHGILARYSSGNLITKKEAKNTLKKYNKKNKELPVGFSIAKKDISLNFD